MSQARLRDEHKELLADLYSRTQKTLDDLPYTEEFERLHASFLNRTGLNLSRHDVWLAIVGVRKSGRLGRTQRGISPPSETNGQEES